MKLLTNALSLTLAIVLNIGISANVIHAQSAELPSCDSVGSDPDGDGFGFQWNWSESQYGSCVITEQSRAKPSFTNASTGAEVELVRAYWNANRDILADYDSEWNRHFAFDPSFEITKAWTLNDGAYDGPMPHDFWLEIVDRNGVAAVRYWGFTIPSVDYYECFDKDGGHLQPTGFIGESLPVTVTTDITPVFVSSSSSDTQETPIINLDTGAEVIPEAVTWNIQSDLRGRQISCLGFQWTGQAYAPNTTVNILTFYDDHNALSTDDGFFTIESFTNFVHNNVWNVENGRFSTDTFHARSFEKLISEPIELLTSSSHGRHIVRTWFDSSSYYECADNGAVVGINRIDTTDASDFAPSGSSPLTNDTSVDDESDVVNNTDGTGTTQDSNVVSNPSTTDDSSGGLEDSNTTNTDTADSLSDDSTGNSDNVATTAEDEDNAVENEVVASDTQAESGGTGQVSTAESTSQSGGGSFWLPVLIFVLAIRRPMFAISSASCRL